MVLDIYNIYLIFNIHFFPLSSQSPLLMMVIKKCLLNCIKLSSVAPNLFILFSQDLTGSQYEGWRVTTLLKTAQTSFSSKCPGANKSSDFTAKIYLTFLRNC